MLFALFTQEISCQSTGDIGVCSHLLLRDFEACTVSYGPCFSVPVLRLGSKLHGPEVPREKKKLQGSVVYSRDQEMRLVRYLLHLCVQIHVGGEGFNENMKTNV